MLVVLQHGLFGFKPMGVGPFVMEYFRGVAERIRQRGHDVLSPGVSPIGGIEGRAKSLKQCLENDPITQKHPGRGIVIIAHSMGGLDARHMIARLGMADRIAALVTIATPHRGSPIADLVTNATDPFAALDIINRLGIDNDAIRNLTTQFCTKFHCDTPDDPGVKYYSIPTDCSGRVPLLFKASFRLVNDREGPNDGVVSVQSARHGIDLGTWQVDHLQAVNMLFSGVVFAWRTDVLKLYDALLDRLEADGVLKASA